MWSFVRMNLRPLIQGMDTVMETDSEQQSDSEDEDEEDEKKVKVQESPPSEYLSTPTLPDSYRQNSPGEVRLLAIADSFQRQYRLLCSERKPLLLFPMNECGVKKFVSTTLRPTMTSHPELLYWEGCASFVADFLSLTPLEPPGELPKFLFSATSVLHSQTATCFEYSAVLCSLLLGANYDAYCVSGYASKEMCLLDQCLQECHLLDNQAKEIVYDLHDIRLWEPVLFGAISKRQMSLNILKRKEMKMMGMTWEDEEEEEDRVFEMPRSWVSYISISKEDLETRWPGSRKLTRYKKTELKTFAPYLRLNGLVTRLTTFKDFDCKEAVTVKEWYKDRNDHLKEREVNKVTGITIERFTPGRQFHLLFHRFTTAPTQGTEHEMEFSGARVDGLVRRVDKTEEMTETFEGREDFLYYRHVVFGHLPEPEDEDADTETEERPLLKVVERFHRNPKKDANEDVAERVFLSPQRKMEVTYHLEEHRFVPCTRTFLKPRESDDFKDDMVAGFHVDPVQKPLHTLTLYKLLSALVEAEKDTAEQIKCSKKEVRDIVSCRQREEMDILLHFSPWTTTGAAKARKQREEMERLAAEEQRWLQEKEKDYLAPFLIQLGNVKDMTAEDARRLYDECMSDFKTHMAERARLIQERHDQATHALQKKQLYYQQSQLNMSHQEEKEYQAFCAEHTFQIHIATERLSMHKRSVAQRYRALDQRLKQDPRLAPYLPS
ncbi:dynein regulatory complex subunit 7 isoform X2 [Entelurus aequoreus]|uniref:dynein regulatory complex subunit 7 isoform X2 n=1 Tax=Entelurus aequoreus TaxID=161455 RepID=UPI002B1D6EC3|nr:dynein regulatory complex subunit 7 isoform X2 [Entelurus aequoreus]